MDRIDIQIELPRLESHELLNRKQVKQEASEIVRMRVTKTRTRQLERQDCLNSRLTNHQIDAFCQLDVSSEKILMTAIDKLKLTARSYHKLLKLARTIADMVDEKNIQQMHLLEAISYRQQDKRQ
tara:strand:- start:134 stop:508 length:375 start_codon:yes stop_codon:yes gene_type:complete